MKIKTQNLIGPALDWAIAKCEGVKIIQGAKNTLWLADEPDNDATEWSPSTNWAQGGPIIEQEKIATKENRHNHWSAKIDTAGWMRGPTPLVAAMRCYVTSKMGDEIEVSDEAKA